MYVLPCKKPNFIFCAGKSKCEGRCKSDPGTDSNDANPKRCRFGLSRKKTADLPENTAKDPCLQGPYSIFLMLSMNFAAESECSSQAPGAAKDSMITIFLAAKTSTFHSMVVPSTCPVPPTL